MYMFVAFFRGINIGSKNKIKMSELKLMFEELGHKQVKTVLNSGNVVFETKLKQVNRIEEQIEEAIRNRFELDITVIVRSRKQIVQLLERDSYGGISDKNCYVILLKKMTDINIGVNFEKLKKQDDLYKIIEKEVYIYVPGGYGKTKLNNALVEKESGVKATTRNINTIIKLQKIMIE